MNNQTSILPSCENLNSSNFVDFLQQINFSIPPPLPVFAAPIAASSSPQIPFPSSCAQFDLVPLLNVPKSHYAATSAEQNNSIQFNKILPNVKKKVESQIHLYQVSHQLRNYHFSLMKLKNDLENFVSNHFTFDDESWTSYITSLSFQKEALIKLKKIIDVDPAFLTLLKYKIKKRKKKRMARKKKELIKKKCFSKYEVAQSHMQRLQQVADKLRQENNLKEEADSVLYSVRQKKGEANNKIQFLNALSKLHAARVHMLSMQNKQPTINSIIGFNKIIDKLKSMWQHQVKECSVEENGLKVMLKDSAEIAENEDCSNLKKTFGQWMKLMFGTIDVQKDMHFSSYNELIEIRDGWDKYVTNEETNFSKIPVGWVIPKYHTHDAWTKFIS